MADACEIDAICIVGDYALGRHDQDFLQVLVVIQDFQPRMVSWVTSLEDRNIIILAVDRWIFERDVNRGFLGEALAQKMMFPYIPLLNRDYLYTQEVKLKRRLVLELLENLVLDFPELSHHLRIKPEYFMYQTLMIRARLFPPMMDLVSLFLQEKNPRKRKRVMAGYLEALQNLEKEDTISFSDGHLKLDRRFAEDLKRKKTRLINLFKYTQRSFFNSVFGTISQALTFLFPKREESFQPKKWNNIGLKAPPRLEDPLQYLYVPTGRGFVPLSSKTGIKDFARRIFPTGEDSEIEVEEIGGVLNDVYLVKTVVKGKEYKIIAKRFKEWSCIKWFPLNLWTLGTTNFAVLPRSRLERECTINQILHSQGLNVPKILHVSHSQRLLFREYLEGERLNQLVADILNSDDGEALLELSPLISKVGELFAEVHSLGVALGDSKPENILVKEETGEVYLLDMEQASQTGDQAWDIAEFLYYTGHFIPPSAGTYPAKLITKAFITGYLKAGGGVDLLKKAGNFQYSKVFTIFTLPHLLLTISTLCKEADKLKNNNPKEGSRHKK